MRQADGQLSRDLRPLQVHGKNTINRLRYEREAACTTNTIVYHIQEYRTKTHTTMLDFKTLYPTPSESDFYSNADMGKHKIAATIARFAEADYISPFDVTHEDLRQYADEHEAADVLELARIKYRLFQYEEFYVAHMDDQQSYRFN